MNKLQKKRLTYIFIVIILLSLALSLILYALKQNINLFYTPTELFAASPTLQPHQTIRIGGYVQEHSVKYNNTGTAVNFTVTDYHSTLPVYYEGLLPNLFREGQTVVILGTLHTEKTDSLFIANQVLAKHDEKYMPKAIADQLKKQGKMK